MSKRPSTTKTASAAPSTAKPATHASAPSNAGQGAIAEQAIDIDHILESEHQARKRSGLQSAAIEELAMSMQHVGMLQPVGVRAAGEKGMYELLWGHRRLLAAKRLGWRSISAVVVDELSALNAIDITIIENAQRSELSPVEEAVAVSSKLNAICLERNSTRWHAQPPAVRDEVITAAANALGKSPTWVRDRAYLARCADKVRDLVQSGHLPLTHAREIAKVVDHEHQEELALSVSAEIDKGGTIVEPPMTFKEVQDLVGRRLFSLPQAPWKLDVEVGGKPACTTCPHNSANQPGLFEHGGMVSRDAHSAKTNWGRSNIKPGADAKAEAGVCLSHSCYMAKTQAVRAVMANAAKKATDALEEIPKTQREKSIASVAKQHAPAIVRPAAFTERVKERVERMANRPSSSASTRSQPQREAVDYEVLHKAQSAYRSIEEKFTKDFNAKLAAAIAKKPGLFTILLALVVSRPFSALDSRNAKSLATAVKSPKLAVLVQACRDVTADASIRKVEAECPTQHDLINLLNSVAAWHMTPVHYAKLAEAAGFDYEALPDEKAFVDAEYKRLLELKKNPPAAAKSAAGKKGKPAGSKGKQAKATDTTAVKTIADMREEVAAAAAADDDTTEEDFDS